MALFKGRSSLLEVQNCALIKTAKERAAQIEKLEAELQSLGRRDDDERGLQSFCERAAIEKLQRELHAAQGRAGRQSEEIERLTLERDFYSKRASPLEEENRELTKSPTKYSVQAQKLERELSEIATRYSLRAQKLERKLTEAATKYSLWG
jgi:predicted  nucleic acid-binding Zn-ribbon protein